MPLPGGAADKIGNRYELWWTVSQFVRIIKREADARSFSNGLATMRGIFTLDEHWMLLSCQSWCLEHTINTKTTSGWLNVST